MIHFPKNIFPPIRAAALIGSFLCLFSLGSSAQNLQLEKVKQYSFLTNDLGLRSVQPDIFPKFINSPNKFVSHLIWNKPGAGPSSIVGSIENQSIVFLDTLMNSGISGDLVDLMFDGNENLYYTVQGSQGGIIKKVDQLGNFQWEHYLSGDTLYSSPLALIMDKESNPILVSRSSPDFLQYQVHISKFDQESGIMVWKTDNLTQSNIFYIPIFVKEFDTFFQVASTKNDSINLAHIDKSGLLLSSNTFHNPNIGDTFRYVNMDSLGHTYLGLNAWGYRCPKIDSSGNLIWHYIKPSPFGDERGNRTKNILLDKELNVYVFGQFRFQDEEKYPLILSKIDVNGNLVWESFIQNLDTQFYFSPDNFYIHEDKIWIAGKKGKSPTDFCGAIACFDLDGNFLHYQDIEEFGPYGFALSMDFYEDEMLLMGSSRAHPDSIFQHIIHYHIDTLTSTTNILPQQITISPYPNPTADWVSIINAPVQYIQELTITSLDGRSIPVPPSMMNNDKINLAGLPAGVYVIRYRIEDQFYLGKVIKN